MKSSARSGYSYHARQRQEFEKRLLIEPRYIQDESGQVYDQAAVYASQSRLASARYPSRDRLSRIDSHRSNLTDTNRYRRSFFAK